MADVTDELWLDTIDKAKILRAIATARREGYRAGEESMREKAAKVADDREAICADAVAKIQAGELYPNTPSAAATEGCARLEARHISALISSIPSDDGGA